jgi:hypothetical protein
MCRRSFILLCVLSLTLVIDAKKASKYEEDFEFIDEVSALNIKTPFIFREKRTFLSSHCGSSPILIRFYK